MTLNKQVIIAYVPVLHAGYKKLFDSYPNAEIYVLGPDLIARFDQLRKELRALKPDEAVQAIQGLGRAAHVLDQSQFDILAMDKSVAVIMPDEDISHELVDHFTGKQVTFSPIFLRWDRRKMESKADPVDPDRTISVEKMDQELLSQAAQAGIKSSNLYRRMGALIVHDGDVILAGYNSSMPTVNSSWIDGDPRNNSVRGSAIDLTTDIHAEARVISEAAKKGVALEGTSMYILDFPCPSCSKLIANSGIAKLYYAAGYSVLDGQQQLNAHGVELIYVEGVDMDPTHTDTWVPYPEKKK